MKPTNSVWKSIRCYWRKKLREGITHTITGQGFAFFLREQFHFVEFFRNNSLLTIVIFTLLGFVPLFIDFLAFRNHHPDIEARLQELGAIVTKLLHRKDAGMARIIEEKIINNIDFFKNVGTALNEQQAHNYYQFLSKGNKIEKIVLEAIKKKNQLMVELILSTMNKELEVVTDIAENRLARKALQHFDYLRDVLGRTLKEVMKPADNYVTLASLDFWTLKPFDCEEFLKVNLMAAFDGQVQIDRVVVIEKKFLTGEGLCKEDMPRFNDFVRLIHLMKDARDELTYHYMSRLKMFFYFHDEYNKIREFLDSIIVLNAKLDELMFIKVKKLAALANTAHHTLPECPHIEINFFGLGSVPSHEIAPHDILQKIKHIKSDVDGKIRSNNYPDYREKEKLMELNKYLSEFWKCFERVSNIYNTTSKHKIAGIDMDKCDFYDAEMMYAHYLNLRSKKPELFLH